MKIVITIIIVLLLPFPLYASTNKWTTTGPFAGSFRSFSFHPTIKNLVFASSSAGLFRSRDGGSNWERLGIAGGYLIVRIHPNKPRTTAAVSSFVYLSNDEGTSWEQIAELPDRFYDLEFHPQDPQILYGVTYDKGVFRSIDGGRNWSAMNSGLKLPAQCCNGEPQLEIDPTDGNIVYLLLPSARLYKSVNGGRSWQLIMKGLKLSGGERTLDMDPKDPKTLYVVSFRGGGIYKTTNGGLSWSSTNCECTAWDLAVDPKNPQNVYAAGTSSVARSTNGGNSWSRVSTPYPLAVSLLGIAVHPKQNHVVFVGSDGGGVFRSQDSGRSWESVNDGVNALSINEMHSHPRDPNRIFAQVIGDQLYESRNGGRAWQIYENLPGIYIADLRIHPKNPDLLIVAGSPGAWVSTDGGRTWLQSSIEGSADRVGLDPQQEKVIFLNVLDDQGLAKSTDQGKTWRFFNTGLTERNLSVIRVSPGNSSIVFAGTIWGKLFHSNNGGKSWKEIDYGEEPRGRVSAIEFDSTDPQTLYVAANGSVFKSTDGGRRWSRQDQGLTQWVDFVSLDPSNPQTLFTGTFGGLFISTDGAESWSVFDSRGLGPFRVGQVFINSSRPDTLFAAGEWGVFSYTIKTPASAPFIKQLSPATGKVGDTVVVQGERFGSTQGAGRLLFTGIDAGTATSWSDTRIVARVPTGARTGAVTVQVANRKSNPFEFIVLPSSGNLEPSSGPASGGTLVTILAPEGISGSQFNVLFAASLARDIRFIAPNIILCITPPGSGTVDVSVTSSAVVARVGTFTYQ